MTASEGRLFQVNVIVLDEVHYLSDISRGTVWEETVCYWITLILITCVHVGHLTWPLLSCLRSYIVQRKSSLYVCQPLLQILMISQVMADSCLIIG